MCVQIAANEQAPIMRNLSPVLLFVALLSPSAVFTQMTAPLPILPDSIHWMSPPNTSGMQGAWILGAEQNEGAYLIRVRLQKGARIPPHKHPDERNSTVLMGTIYVGFGETFDETKVVAIPTGGVYVAPANVPHYVWAKDGDAIYQESGMGPTRSTFMKK